MKDLTTGSLTQHLLQTTSYMLVTMLFQTLYVLVDLYWVGRLGTEAVAAVGISGNLLFIVLAATQMLSVGTTTLVAHAVGRRDRDRANLVFNQAQVLSAVVGTVFLALALAFKGSYAEALSADAVTRDLTNDYLAWFIPSQALTFLFIAMGAALRGTGNFRPGMIVQTATVIINIVLAPVLIFGWGTGRPLGVAGAAVATFLAILIGVVWMAFYFRPADAYLRFHRHQWHPRLDLWSGMLKIGLPAGAEFAMMALYLVLVYFVSRPFGASAQAGFGIGLRIVQACFLPVVALGFAVSPVAGQNFGARQAGRVRETFRIAALIAAGGMLVLAIAVWLAAARMVQVFSLDPAVIDVGEEYLHVIAWNFVASGVIFVSSSMFQAMGNTIPSLITSAFRIVLIAVPVLLLANARSFALLWVWYISVAGMFVQLGLNLLLLRREFRTRLAFEPAPAAEA
ncbi:MAG TPA: MATE family efflux transporter [Vicinamibacterales bacterium]|jgi:putative MATE family efflux protein|nr:MATE family efflux transporter [Vicinamibacterales bacterium]